MFPHDVTAFKLLVSWPEIELATLALAQKHHIQSSKHERAAAAAADVHGEEVQTT